MNERPIGVTILAALHTVGGLALLFVQGLMLANISLISERLGATGILLPLIVFGLLFLTSITLASGIGMWLGTRWGWWCATFYYVYSLARNLNMVFTASDLADLADDASRGPSYYQTKFGIRAVIGVLILMYLFKSNVLDYFELSDVNKGKAIGILAGLTAAVFMLTLSVTWLFGG